MCAETGSEFNNIEVSVPHKFNVRDSVPRIKQELVNGKSLTFKCEGQRQNRFFLTIRANYWPDRSFQSTFANTQIGAFTCSEPVNQSSERLPKAEGQGIEHPWVSETPGLACLPTKAQPTGGPMKEETKRKEEKEGRCVLLSRAEGCARPRGLGVGHGAPWWPCPYLRRGLHVCWQMPQTHFYRNSI